VVTWKVTWQDIGSRRLYVARARLYVARTRLYVARVRLYAARESSDCGPRCTEMTVCVSLRCPLCVGAATETLASGLT